ncbi:MAG: HD domain-containing protein [Clostridiales bacterium]|nr:HD domain-containing protein [Clostridiales bacterium]
MDSPMLNLIRRNDWGQDQPRMDALSRWEGWSLFLETLTGMDRAALYESPIHGPGHIERVLLHGAFCAMEEPLGMEDTALLLECCAYHDVGRVDDTYDTLHGWRSAQRLAALTGRKGEELKMMQAAVDAHSRPEKELISTLERYQPEDFHRCLVLTQLLKDADGLDRVRIWDLAVRHLRRESSRRREDFAQRLFEAYQAEAHASTTPPFPPELLAELAEKRARRQAEREKE